MIGSLLFLVFLTPALLALPATASSQGWEIVGPPGGPVTSLALAETPPAAFIGPVVYAGTFHGVLRSIDGGGSWERLAAPPADGRILDLAVVPDAFRTVYALTQPSPPLASTSAEPGLGFLIRSRDGGETWQSLADAPVASTVTLAPSDPDVLYLGTRAPEPDGPVLHRSDDGGDTWRTLSTPPTFFVVSTLAVDPTDPNRLWSGGPNGIARSTDGGSSWQVDISSRAALAISSLAVSPVDRQRLWAGGRGGVLTSIDGGATWTVSESFTTPDAASFPSTWVAADATDADTAYRAHGGTVARTRDGGVTWQELDRTLSGARDLVITDADGGLLLVSDDDGVGRSLDDGETWERLLRELSLRPVVQAVPLGPPTPSDSGLPETPLAALDVEGGLWIQASFQTPPADPSPDRGDWRRVVDDAVRIAALPGSPADQPQLLVLRDRLGPPLWRVRVEGEPAEVTVESLPFPRQQVLGGETIQLELRHLAVSPRDPRQLWIALQETEILASLARVFTTVTHHLWRSDDGGLTWNDVAGELLPPVHAVTPSPHVDGLVYAGTDEGLYVSHDDGATWRATEAAAGQQTPPQNIRHVAVDRTTPGRLLFAGGGAVARSDDFGATASRPLLRGLPREPLGVAGLISREDGRFEMALRRLGLFTSADVGDAWLSGSGSLGPGVFTGRLALQPNSAFRPRLWAGTAHGAARLTGGVPCHGDGDTHCLADGRFRVEVIRENFQGVRGDGRTFPLTSDTGSFWFFDPDNLELVVKVLDGRTINDHWWVFAGALTNVPYTLLVEDTLTGAVRSYANPSGRFASFGDTLAFATPAPPPPARLSTSPSLSSPSSWQSIGSSPASTSEAPAVAAEVLRIPSGGVLIPLPAEAVGRTGDAITPVPACRNDETSLCLNLFGIGVRWKDFQGGEGVGKAIPLTDDTGAFWFFDPDNVELMVKVIDGTEVNGHHWLFLASLTNVEFTVRIVGGLGLTFTDLEITNPPGTFASRAVLDEL